VTGAVVEVSEGEEDQLLNKSCACLASLPLLVATFVVSFVGGENTAGKKLGQGRFAIDLKTF
tara:strand:+ start:129 stop:314 length:186 start_codon:yes stop_codon:yes gene_type:complete